MSAAPPPLPLPSQPGQAGYAVLVAGHRLLAIALGLTALGLVMVYSISWGLRSIYVDVDSAREARFAGIPARQLRWVAVALLFGAAAALVRLETLRRVARPLLAAALVLLLATLLFGPRLNGSRRWLVAAGLSVQTSEIFKVALLLYLADRLAAREGAQSFGQRLALLPLLLPAFLGAGLVFLAPDLGTALFLLAEAVVLLGLAGVRPSRVALTAFALLPGAVLLAWRRLPHVRERVELFLTDPQPGTQVREALVALGSGGALGRGLGDGVQKMGWVAECHNDFILAVIGEELGFAGCTAVVLAFMAFAVYGRRVAWQARVLGPFAFHVAAGATFIVVFQALMNVAVVTASTPAKGVSMPFISAGGSNLVLVAVCVGLLLNVSRRAALEAAEAPLD